MTTHLRSEHALISPPVTEVIGTALRTASMVTIFVRCLFCGEATDAECPSNGTLHPVLQCDPTGKLFSVVFEKAARGYGGMQALRDSRHRRFRVPELSVPASSSWAERFGYVIRAQCPFCGEPAQVLNAKPGDLDPVLRCGVTGEAFAVHFPDPRDSARLPICHA